MKLIPIIIPAYKNESALNKCKSLCIQQNYQPIELFVWDNSEENILFTPAINRGIKKYINDQNIDFILILNQDAYLQKDTLNYLVGCMEMNPKCGIACPIQYDESKNQIYWAGGLAAYPEGEHLTQIPNINQDFYKTFWANGAAMLLRLDMVREIGFLDENMKFIFSDADYSLTARARGWDVLVSKNARVNHGAGQSGDAANDFIQQIKIDDSIYFSSKWIDRSLYDSLAFDVNNRSHSADRAKHLFYLGLNAIEKSSFHEAKSYLQKALDLAPGRPSVQINLSVALIGLGENSAAVSLLRDAIKTSPNEFDCLLNLGIAEKNLGNYLIAIELFDQALIQRPGYPEAFLNKGICLLQTKKFDEALCNLDQALIQRPGYPEALINKGLCLISMGLLDEGFSSVHKGLYELPTSLKR